MSEKPPEIVINCEKCGNDHTVTEGCPVHDSGQGKPEPRGNEQEERDKK